MATNSKKEPKAIAQTLGDLLQHARLEAGYTIKGLAAMSGVPISQIGKLEHDQVQKPNAAHLAALAEPLKLTIYQLYRAAGYQTPACIAGLTPELERALARLPDHALAKVESYVEGLLREHGNGESSAALADA